MQDHELYRRILGIEAPWQVERVELQLQQGEVHVYLAHQNQSEWACAECGALGPVLRKKSMHREFMVTNSETHSCPSQHTDGMLPAP